MKKGPILLVDDDLDECEVIKDALERQKIENELICFPNGIKALEYLRTTTGQPFLILSDLNMPGMGGLELRKILNEDPYLKEKSIPFVFLTTTPGIYAVREAYELSVQGFFEKGKSMQEIGELLREIYNYWQRCRHPNN